MLNELSVDQEVYRFCAIIRIEGAGKVCADGDWSLKKRHCCYIWTHRVHVDNWVVLRVVDGDGGGGLTAVEMVKYTANG